MTSNVEGRAIKWLFVLWREQKQLKLRCQWERKQASSKCRGSLSAVAAAPDTCPSRPAPPPMTRPALGPSVFPLPTCRRSQVLGQGGHSSEDTWGPAWPEAVCGPGLSCTCCVHEGTATLPAVLWALITSVASETCLVRIYCIQKLTE